MVAVQNSSPYPVSITSSAGVQYNFPVDTSFEPYRREAFRHRTIPSQRQSVNLTNITGEGTVNTEGLWRREQTEWSMGAGQYSLDRKGDSQETRFLSSKGVDVFSLPLQATLLPDTHRLDGSGTVGANFIMSRCGDYVVTANGATVTYYDSSWTPTSCTSGTTYGGSAWTVVNSITTNDTYCFLGTDTGIWFCQIGTSSVFQLYASNDLTTGYTGGYTLVRWANDQLIAAYKNRLYAILPRDGSATAPYGSSPSTASGTTSIQSILGLGGFLSVPGQAQITTTSPHNLTNNQKITSQATQMVGDITNIALSSGYVTATCSLNHGLSVGQTATVSLTYTSGKVISESVTVSSVSGTDPTKFSYKTSKVSSVLHFSFGQFISSQDGYGFNSSYNAIVFTPSAVSITATAPSTPSSGYVTYTINQVYTPSVGDTAVIAGLTPSGYNGTFVVTNVGGSTGAWTVTVANSTTGAASGSGTYLNQSRTFSIVVPRTNGSSGSGGTVSTAVSPDVLYTHENPNWVWSDATDGETQIYFAGYVSGAVGKYSGCIYRSDLPGASTTSATQTSVISATAVAQPWELNTPIQALPMSPDEYPVCIKSYLNFIFIGTNRGIRMTQTLSIYDPTATATGDLKSGPLIPNILQPVTLPVSAIVGDGRFVWFAWNNYDANSTGLGKLDLSTYIAGDPLTPAYASDLMVTGQGNINSLDWNPSTNTPMMAVASEGIYGPYARNSGGNMVVTQYVPSGTITSGIFDYGISDPKVPVYFDYDANTPGSTTVTATDSVDGAASTSATSGSYQTNQGYPVTQTRGRQFSVTVTLNAATTSTTYDTSPTLHRWVLKAWPAVVAGTAIMLVIQNYDVNLVDNQEVFNDPYATFVWLEGLRLIQDFVTYTEGPISVVCTVDGMDLLPHKLRDSTIAAGSGGYESDLVVTLRTQGNYVYTAPETTV